MEDIDLLKQMQQAEAELAEMRSRKAEQDRIENEAKEALARIRDEYAEKIHRLRLEQEEAAKAEQERLTAVKENKWQQSIDLRKKEREYESLKRQMEQAERAKAKTAEWKTLEQRWDLLTAGAPWREWAKDHQIQGAKKITYEGSLILGDTMGLGKTLTALIAMDMIQAATKDASPDNPVEFGSMK